MATKNRIPDTEIPCCICRGTKKSVYGHPNNDLECGACFGTGLSTNSCDQKRNGSTVGSSMPDGSGYTLDLAKWEAAMKEKDPTFVYHKGHHYQDRPSVVNGPCKYIGHGASVPGQQIGWQGLLISWANPDYEARLAAYKAGNLIGYH